MLFRSARMAYENLGGTQHIQPADAMARARAPQELGVQAMADVGDKEAQTEDLERPEEETEEHLRRIKELAAQRADIVDRESKYHQILLEIKEAIRSAKSQKQKEVVWEKVKNNPFLQFISDFANPFRQSKSKSSR